MAKQGGYGLVCRINISGTMTAIANILDADIPEFEKFLDDITAHDSTGGYTEYIATGLRGLGAFKLTLTWDVAQTTHAALVTAFNSDATVTMNIQDPDGSELISFSAHVKKIGRIAKQKNGYKADIEVQPTGLPTIT